MRLRKIIKPADRVYIRVGNHVRTGTVIEANDHGDDTAEAWEITLDAKGIGRVTWKQADGGGIVSNLTTFSPWRDSMPRSLYDFVVYDGVHLNHALMLYRTYDTMRGKRPETMTEWREVYDALKPLIARAEAQQRRKEMKRADL